MRIRFIVFSFFFCLAYTKEIYDPSADAMADISRAVTIAKKSNKHVFVKVGGNWCGWCKLYDKFSNADEDITLVMIDEYITVLANRSTENRNLESMN